jgi:transcriptional regulator with XRE-family HTH domain
MSQGKAELREIGRRIKQLRDAEGMTQTQFAKKVGLTQAAISQFEEGKRIPSTQALQKIAVGLELSIDELIGNISASSDSDSEKESAIQAIVAKLRSKDKDAIIALNRFIDVGMVGGKTEDE